VCANPKKIVIFYGGYRYSALVAEDANIISLSGEFFFRPDAPGPVVEHIPLHSTGYGKEQEGE